MPKIVWSPAARRDLQESIEFIQEFSPAAAAKLASKVVDALELLEAMPEMGPVMEQLEDIGQYRYLLVAKHLIIYRLEDDAILIQRFWDARRSPDSLVVK